MIPRSLERAVGDRLRAAAAVLLLGPRQVGKTTLALHVADARGDRALYLDLELPADRRRLDDAAAFFGEHEKQLIVIDEVHQAPALFEVLRSVIDARRRRGRRHGHFLLLGSAALDLMRQGSESLAGRIAYLELAPIGAVELPARGPSLQRLWVRGGLPESLLARTDARSLRWRQDFIRSYLERDVPMFAPRLPAATVGRLWTMLAHGQGTLLNQSRLAASLGVSAPAVARYVDLLSDLLLVRRLPAWSGNVGKRLVRAPKVYVRDSGLVHALLELGTWDDMIAHPVAGASWEGFVIEQLIAAGGDARTASFYRTEDGAEVDLVFERGGSVEMLIEIKRSSAPDTSRGFLSAIETLRPRHAFVVHGGTESWPMRHGVSAVSVPEMLRRLAKG